MLADVESRGACFCPSPSPYTAPMPSRQMTSALKGEKHIVSKKPLHNSVNQQKLDNGCQPQEVKSTGRRRGRARGKAAERQVKLEVEAGLQKVAPPVSSKGIVFCRRPGFGQEGTRCIVKANHFLAELPDKDLNQYDVSVYTCSSHHRLVLVMVLHMRCCSIGALHLQVTIIPEVSCRSMNRAIIAELVRLYRETELGTRLPAYDGRKSLYTAGSLPFNSKEFIIRLVEDDDGMGVTRFY